MHRGRRGRAGRDLHDAGAELDAFGVGGDQHERGEGVGPPRLGGPDRIEAGLLGLDGHRDEVLGHRPAPVPECESQIHARGRYSPAQRLRIDSAVQRSDDAAIQRSDDTVPALRSARSHGDA